MENLLGTGFKGKFYKKWRTDILYDKRYSEFDGSFKKQTLQGKVYIREPSIES